MYADRLTILSTQTLLPPLKHEIPEVEEAFLGWLSGQSEAFRVRALRLLRGTGIETRHSFLTLEEVFTPCGLTESMTRYQKHAIELGTRVLRCGLHRAGVEPGELDVLITTSCSGYMIPSVDAYMADELGMRPDLIRLPVTEMGCAAGASALIYAAQMLRGRPGTTAAVVTIEFPSNTMQLDNFSMDNIVGTTLFSDGLTCTVLRQQREHARVEVLDWGTHQISRTTELLGYHLTDSGLVMNLDATLPDVIGEHFETATRALLERNGLTLGDIRHFVLHPGGTKILDRIDERIQPHGGSVALTREVMRRHGNMSSSTVGFVLDELLRSDPEPGLALMLSFGPGFGANQLLLQIGEGHQP